jgi:signal transduction histidine kinase
VTSFLADCFRSVDMTPEDLGRLAALEPRLAPHFPAIARAFYAAAVADPRAARVFSSPEQIQRLQHTLVEWMVSGLRGPHDDAFYEKRSRIGRRHVEIGLDQQFVFTGMTLVRLAYQEHILAAMSAPELGPTLAAMNKLLDVELAVMVRHYQLDSEARVVEREQRAQAERVRAMQTLTAGLAHEVRNPLNAAKLQLDLLDRRLRRLSSDPDLIRPGTLVAQEIARLTTLLNDFLAFARPPELHLGERDLVELARHVCDMERPGATLRGATLEVVGVEALVARVDGAKVHQIIANLVRNAIEAVGAGGRVSVELADAGANVVLRVTDDGGGIPADIQARIFEPFFSTKDTGTGLGMSIVHSLATLHGGTIALETGERGTRFEITIPRAP